MEVFIQSITDTPTGEKIRPFMYQWNDGNTAFFANKNYGPDIDSFRIFLNTFSSEKAIHHKFYRAQKIYAHAFNLSWDEIMNCNNRQVFKLLYKTITDRFDEAIPKKSRKIDFDFDSFKEDLLRYIEIQKKIKAKGQ